MPYGMVVEVTLTHIAKDEDRRILSSIPTEFCSEQNSKIEFCSGTEFRHYYKFIVESESVMLENAWAGHSFNG